LQLVSSQKLNSLCSAADVDSIYAYRPTVRCCRKTTVSDRHEKYTYFHSMQKGLGLGLGSLSNVAMKQSLDLPYFMY